ncbi:MAG TPA: hypothetical protein VGF67_00945 [Ktedonobacteraceae bacterium]|jgi:hypothetical protein
MALWDMRLKHFRAALLARKSLNRLLALSLWMLSDAHEYWFLLVPRLTSSTRFSPRPGCSRIG